MINTSNIKAYINFLHLKKYSAPATEELKTRWASVPDMEIAGQLKGLYQHWGIDPATASLYEQVFLQSQQSQQAPPAYEQPYHPPAYQQQPVQPQQQYIPAPASKSKTPLIIGLVVLLLAAAGAVVFLMTKDGRNPETANANTTIDSSPKAAPVTEQSAVEPHDTAIPATQTVYDEDNATEADDDATVKIETIRSLISGEENRNMTDILNSFSPDMEQYWDISYPTQEELVKRYNSVWTKSGNGKHNHIRIDEVSHNTYDLYADYEFYSVKDQVSKALNVHVRYVFDDNGKIIKTYGVK